VELSFSKVLSGDQADIYRFQVGQSEAIRSRVKDYCFNFPNRVGTDHM